MSELKSITLPVTGMTCANCAASIERNVRKLPGVGVADVNLASEKLVVAFDPAQLDEHGIIARVERIGYGVPTGNVELPITGLRDGSDAVVLEKLLARQEGVLAAGVSYGTERVTLQFIPGVTSIAELAGTIRKAGFDLVQAAKPNRSRMWKPRCGGSKAPSACHRPDLHRAAGVQHGARFITPLPNDYDASSCSDGRAVRGRLNITSGPEDVRAVRTWTCGATITPFSQRGRRVRPDPQPLCHSRLPV